MGVRRVTGCGINEQARVGGGDGKGGESSGGAGRLDWKEDGECEDQDT